MYNPTGPLEDTEFVELVNLSATETIELGNATFVAGIEFTFPLNTTLAPGHRLLLVSNTTAFEAEHGAGLSIAGEFAGSLDNDGEQLILPRRLWIGDPEFHLQGRAQVAPRSRWQRAQPRPAGTKPRTRPQ